MYRLWIEKALMSFRSRNTWEMRVAWSPSVPWTTSSDESKFPSSYLSCFCATKPLKTYVSKGIQFHPKKVMGRRRQNFPVKKQQSILVGNWLACGWFPQTGNLVVNTAAVFILRWFIHHVSVPEVQESFSVTSRFRMKDLRASSELGRSQASILSLQMRKPTEEIC